MKVLFMFDKGSNCLYLRRMFDILSDDIDEFSYTMVRPDEYMKTNQDIYDLMIYQTFPGEFHPFKFKAEVIARTDEKFHEFKGQKVLMDSFDDGAKDGFSRMKELSKQLPRIKSVPSWEFIGTHNVVFDVPPYFGMDNFQDEEDGPRTVMIHYSPTLDVGPDSHKIRKEVWNVLHRECNGEVNFKRLPRKSYPSFLRKTLVSITAPGYGPCSNTFWTAMQYGTLSMAEESVDRYKLIPRTDLVPGEDYMSFSTDTLVDKLKDLLADREKCDKIRKSGYKKIRIGYDLKESAKELYQALKRL